MDFVKPDVQHTYLRHKEINEYLGYLEHRYATFVRVYTIGKSYEGRLVKGIEIDWCSERNAAHNTIDINRRPHSTASTPTTKQIHIKTERTAKKQAKKKKKKQKKKGYRLQPLTRGRNLVFIEAGAHAREWITISVALYCIQQLTEKHLRHRDILEKLRFFIVPLVNPDGYEYTYNKDRLWRKNRRPNSNSKSIGTDCNRNYDFHWESGSSKEYRSTFKGESPFSEPETSAVRNVMLKLRANLLFFLSLHAYAQTIMYPWGYTKELPLAWQQLQKLADCGKDAIKELTGRIYRSGSISEITKRTYSGTIVDYAFGIMQVPLALVMELPSSEFGFQPAKELIRPIGTESWIGIKAMCKYAFELGRSMVEPTKKDAATDVRDLLKSATIKADMEPPLPS